MVPAGLPRQCADVARDWDLTTGRPYDLSCYYVTAVTCGDGTPAVLKLGVPLGDSLRTEGPALNAFAGRGAVRLLRADLSRGALLLERAEPGWHLSELVPTRDAEATSAAVGIMRQLGVRPPANCRMPDVLTLCAAFDDYLAIHGESGPLPSDLVAPRWRTDA